MTFQVSPFAFFVPNQWYWLADDGRVFSGPLESVVTTSDPDYVAWTGLGNIPTAWPHDEDGNQTDAALQDVLMPFGMFANLIYYAADARYRHATGGLTISSLSAIPFYTDPVARNTLANANEYAKVMPNTVDWKVSDGSFIRLSPSQLTTAAGAMANFVQACFTCESTTVSGVNGGSITTKQQVDDAFAAVPNVVP